MARLQARIIIEIMGRPPEHVKQAMEGIMQKMASEKGVTILDKTVHEPVPVKESKDLFTTFSEITLELDSLANYFTIVFSYMPSNIELINPQQVSLSNFDLNAIANQITQRLHSYDAITKKVIVERNMALEKLKEVAPHLFKKPQEPAKSKKKAKKPKKKTRKTKKSKK